MHEVVKLSIENGTPTIHVQGVKGKACKDITKALEKALGTVTSTKATTEMYEQQQDINARH